MDHQDRLQDSSAEQSGDFASQAEQLLALQELTDQVVGEFNGVNENFRHLGERAALFLPRLRQLLSLRRREFNLATSLRQHGVPDAVAEEGRQGAREFDLALATRHTYLGDVEDLESTGAALESGHRCCLPLLSLPGVVLGPGTTLPLRLTTRQSSHIARMALSAPQPYCCLLVVVCWNLLTQGHGLVACVTEVRQMKEFDDGSVNCLAVGRQRCRIRKLKGGCKAEVAVLGEDSLVGPPREAASGCAAWPQWTYRLLDPSWLACKARQAYAEFAPQVQPPGGCPRILSFWLAANVPLHYCVRQELLAMNSTCYRLRRLIELLQAMKKGLTCRKCGVEVAYPSDLLAMSEAGSGSVFVNAHGFTHEMLTIKAVHGVGLEGFPQTEHSWFPGYAWTIARCASCDLQLGWRFTAVDHGLQPASFWGLRTQAIKYSREGEPRHPAEPFAREPDDDDDDF